MLDLQDVILKISSSTLLSRMDNVECIEKNTIILNENKVISSFVDFIGDVSFRIKISGNDQFFKFISRNIYFSEVEDDGMLLPLSAELNNLVCGSVLKLIKERTKVSNVDISPSSSLIEDDFKVDSKSSYKFFEIKENEVKYNFLLECKRL